MKPLSFLIFVFWFCCLPHNTSAQTSYKVTATRVNVRNKPSLQALVVGVVNQGEVISVLDVSNGWATILFKEKTRYVDARYIEPVDKVTKTTNKTKKGKPTKQKNNVEPTTKPSPGKLSDFKKQKKKEEKVLVSQPSEPKDGELSFLIDVFGGYSNFRCDNISPKPGIGFGAGIGLQYDYSRISGKMPLGLFGEITIGYSCRGSGAYPIHYAGARVLPIGYRHILNLNFSIIGKAGMYIAYPFSEIKTQYNSYKTSLDYGLSVGLGIEWKQFGVAAIYEHGFAKVNDGGHVELFNQGAFFTLSYKIRTF